MNNGGNKIVVGIISGIIIGSIGTSYIGNFQSESHAANINNTYNSQQFNQGTSEYPGKGGHNHKGQGNIENVEGVDVSSGQYKDGVYEGEAVAYAPGLNVDVTISDGKISDVQISSHNETPGFYEQAFQTVPQQIIQSQSTDVDMVSGATYSSVGIINAVNDALSNANKQY